VAGADFRHEGAKATYVAVASSTVQADKMLAANINPE